MRSLRELLGLFEGQSTDSLTPEMIDALIKKYSVKKWSPKLTWVSHSFKKTAGGQATDRPGGIRKQWDDIAAMFTEPNIIEINEDDDEDIRARVLTILHEIQHYNQSIRWENDPSYRDELTRKKKLPSSVADDPLLLYELEWWSLVQFWERRYGYERSPHERDAWEFAERHIDDAMRLVSRQKKR